jgi:hypothetical protein
MSKNKFPNWYGNSAADEVEAALRAGDIDSIVLAAAATASLSQVSRELIRRLRELGARVEFYQRGDVDAAIHAANKLLADVPVDQLTAARVDEAPRLLLIDGAEQLDESELLALQRLSRALRGSTFRTVYFLKAESERGLAESLQRLVQGSPTWWIEGTAPIDSAVTRQTPEFALEPAPEPASEAAATPKSAAKSAASVSIERDVAERDDVLTALAAERARERGFDATHRPWWALYGRAVTMLVIVVLLIAGGWFAQSQLTEDKRLRVYDCGVYSDEATLDIVRERLGRTVPTRVLREQDKWRLQVGPFEGTADAERHLSQIWGIGPCRVNPSIVQNTKKKG